MMAMIVGSAASEWSYAEPYLGAREPIIVVIDRQRPFLPRKEEVITCNNDLVDRGQLGNSRGDGQTSLLCGNSLSIGLCKDRQRIG